MASVGVIAFRVIGIYVGGLLLAVGLGAKPGLWCIGLAVLAAVIGQGLGGDDA